MKLYAGLFNLAVVRVMRTAALCVSLWQKISNYSWDNLGNVAEKRVKLMTTGNGNYWLKISASVLMHLMREEIVVRQDRDKHEFTRLC
jgi:hypothetical protein